jgi:siderophore synthetase component
MIDEHKLLRDQAKASRAQDLIENELLQEAFKTLEDAYTSAWRTSSVADTAAREKLFLAVNIVGKVRGHLTAVLNNGKLAAQELRAIADTAERKKRYGII